MPRIADPQVAEAFRAFPKAAPIRLLALRETEKGGDASFLTPSGAGSTIRLGWKAKAPDEVAMYFICTTGLVDRFRELYPRSFRYGGNRALLFPLEGRIQEKALRHCIALALTYHRK